MLAQTGAYLYQGRYTPFRRRFLARHEVHQLATSARISPVMRIPPPLWFVVTFLAALGAQRFVPLTIGATSLTAAAHFAGLALVAAGLLLGLSSISIFLSARTTIIPFGTAKQLVANGPFRFTRNPMYVGLALLYVGVAGILVELWPLILLPLPILVMDRIVIPFEEARLQAVFAEAYHKYCTTVRRWI
jgi:protein-S-isoprenylcysteine O-methyltransferase Ste14